MTFHFFIEGEHPGSDHENPGPTHTHDNINIYIIEYRDELIQTNKTTNIPNNACNYLAQVC